MTFFLTMILLVSFVQCMIQVIGAPVITGECWSDTFEDDNGILYSYNVNISDGDVYLKGFRDNFEDDVLNEIPVGWTREYGDAGSDFNKHIVVNNPYEPTKSLYMLCNDDLSNYAWQKLWKDFGDYYHLMQFELTLRDISPSTNRQGYFYVQFFNESLSIYHEVRYYWDEGRSGIPLNSSSITAIDLIAVLPTGQNLGIKYYFSENVSEDIEANTLADLSSILDNISMVRYGFYQDAGPGWDHWEQVYADNIGLYDDTKGNIKSIEISLPLGFNYTELRINKTEPNSETRVYVSVLDSKTDIIIPGFNNLLGTQINISSIDPTIYSKITLFANLNGTGNSTPILHDWSVSWVNLGPPETPTGLVVSNPLNGYSLILSWNSNTESDLDHYRIYYSFDNITFNWLVDVPGDSISFIHYGLTKGTTYYYKIAAVDTASNFSPNSTAVEGIPDIDSDLDGIGNIADPDDDNDGIPDISDPYPLNPLNEIETKIDDIISIVSGLNLTKILDSLDYLNKTLPAKVDTVSLQLMGMNDSLQNLLSDITLKIKDMNSTLSGQLTGLLNNITVDHENLRTWLDVVLDLIDTNLTATRNSLEDQLNALNSTISLFYDNLDGDLANIRSQIQQHDDITGQDHSEIITYLNDLLNNDDLQSQDLNILKTMLTDLAGNLSGHNQTIVDDILTVISNIGDFRENTDERMDDINSTLQDLAKLQDIINDLATLSQALDTMNNDLKDSIEDKSKEEEIEDRVKFVEMLVMIIIILLIVNLVMTLVMGMRRKPQKEGTLGRNRPAEELHYPKNHISKLTPENIDQNPEPSIIQDNEFPPPPPPE